MLEFWTAAGVAATVMGFLAAVVYRYGRLSARVEAIEEWRHEVRLDMREIREGLRSIERFFANPDARK